MNPNLEHSFPTSLLLQHLKDLDLEYLWYFWHDVRACEAENELVQPIILMQSAGGPSLSCPVMGTWEELRSTSLSTALLRYPLHWCLMLAELFSSPKRESLPHSPDSSSGFSWLKGWISAILTLCHRHRELCFTFHPLLLNKSYRYCTLHVNTAIKWWLQPRKYLCRAGSRLLPFPLLDLKAFSSSLGRKTQVSAGELQLS